MFCTPGPNLAIPALTGDELSRWQARDRYKDIQRGTQRHAGDDNTRRLKLVSDKSIDWYISYAGYTCIKSNVADNQPRRVYEVLCNL